MTTLAYVILAEAGAMGLVALGLVVWAVHLRRQWARDEQQWEREELQWAVFFDALARQLEVYARSR